MADTIKSSNELKMVAGFYDSDDRTITVQNPIATLAAADIHAFETVAQNTQAILGDKAGAAFVSIKSAKTVQKTKTDLDLTLI